MMDVEKRMKLIEEMFNKLYREKLEELKER
jgi:hypothetical protein